MITKISKKDNGQKLPRKFFLHSTLSVAKKLLGKILVRMYQGKRRKLCQALALDKSFYGVDLCQSAEIWLEDGEEIKKEEIIKKPRVGIDYAGPYWSKVPWRFYIKDNAFVSKG